MKRPNPLSPTLMSAAERRAELCGLLALALVRLRQREHREDVSGRGESCLHFPADRCRHATANERRSA
jgi:hypothetical protein